MKIANNKTITFAIVLIFFTSALIETSVPRVSAQTSGSKATYAYIGAVPNPVNVGGETLLHLGITDAIGTASDGWTGLTVTITKPDGTNITLGPFKTDSTGGTGTVFVPDKVGNYTVITNFPEQIYQNRTYKASHSTPLTLVAIEGQIDYYPSLPLPTEYWTRPIDPQIRSWYTVAGNWLTSSPDNLYVPYNEAPESAHVLWTKPFTTGGLVGGDVGLADSENQGPVGYETGDAYQGKWTSRFIIGGVLIYCHHTSVRPLEYTAVNLRTGEELWKTVFLNNLTISMCQTFYWQSYNYMGTYSYIWVTSGSDWYAFDPFDAKLRLTITNIPSGTTIVGSRGEIYRYSISTTTGRMTLWNMSALISMAGSFLGPGPSTYNASATVSATNLTLTTAAQRAYALNFTFPTGLTGSVQQVWLGDRFIGANINSTHVRLWAISLKSGQEGTKMYDNTWAAPSAWNDGNQSVSWMAWSRDSKVAVCMSKETCENYGFNLDTGNYIWGPTPPEHYLNSLDDTKTASRAIAYGLYFSASVSGIVYCYNVTTGDLVWTYHADDPYTEILWSNGWWLKPLFISDGKIYVGHLEHSANQPLPRGAPFICLNATTGDLIWRVNGMFRQTRWGGRAIMGDSVIATMDTYDQSVWAVGKGPSAMTVEAPDDGVTLGSSVTIKGRVTDVSPGTKSDEIALRFSTGVPAVSDESMSDWMLYVYKQFPRPTNATGVDVTVSVVDANGNFREIGTTRSSSDGFFSLPWTPDIQGEYQVYATFAGSKSYFGSHAESAFFVDSAPTTPTPEPTQPVIAVDLYFLPAIAGLFVFVAIMFVITILVLRKRP
jgi:outer membrane protein assembly factor BamB